MDTGGEAATDSSSGKTEVMLGSVRWSLGAANCDAPQGRSANMYGVHEQHLICEIICEIVEAIII